MLEVIVVFDLGGQPAAQWHVAYQALARLGFSNVANGVTLPAGVLIGAWYEEATVPVIRNTLIVALRNAGAPARSLLVGSYVELAWLGEPVPQR